MIADREESRVYRLEIISGKKEDGNVEEGEKLLMGRRRKPGMGREENHPAENGLACTRLAERASSQGLSRRVVIKVYYSDADQGEPRRQLRSQNGKAKEEPFVNKFQGIKEFIKEKSPVPSIAQINQRSPNIFDPEPDYSNENSASKSSRSKGINSSNREGANMEHSPARKLPKNTSFEKLQNRARHEEYGNLREDPQTHNIDVRIEDFFIEGNSQKLLHYFQPKSKNFYYLDLDAIGPEPQNLAFSKMRLDIDFDLPRQLRSVCTTQGFIFLSGGVETVRSGNVESQRVLRSCYILHFDKKQLIPIANMLIGRSQHNLAVLNDEIYAIGGFTDQNEFTGSCEKYNAKDETWKQLPSLKRPSLNASTCTFNNRYIYRIGGKINYKDLNERIDRFDSATNKWQEIALETGSISPMSKAFFRVLSLSGCLQVSYDTIFVFGGTYEDYQNKSNGSYLIRVRKDTIFQERPELHEIVGVNEHLLPVAEGFWNQQAIVHNRQIFALQNVSKDGDGESVCLDKRRVLLFDNNLFRVVN